ncbi:response regulator [Pirellulaceae bacterium SH501]
MKALVVEDDPTIVDMVEDVLFSLSYEFDVATNQQDAKELLAKTQYSFVLLDLQIPAKANRGGADKQYGINLLRDIQRLNKPSPPPVIMMTAHLADCLDISVELQRNGVRDFISKPFHSKGRTLSSVIQSVLESSGDSTTLTKPVRATTSIVKEQPLERRRFDGGQMVFESGRLTLCGVPILVRSRSKLTWRILELLSQRTQNGSWVAKSGPEIAEELGLRSGQNGVSGAIRDFRKNVTELLSAELGLDCERDDVIRSGGPGYRLHEWIRVENTDRAGVQMGEEEGSNRRDQILELLDGGRPLRTTAIAAALGCSQATAKRELDILRSTGAIEFVGPAKTGTYQIVGRLS